jgi:hypothetical protein
MRCLLAFCLLLAACGDDVADSSSAGGGGSGAATTSSASGLTSSSSTASQASTSTSSSTGSGDGGGGGSTASAGGDGGSGGLGAGGAGGAGGDGGATCEAAPCEIGDGEGGAAVDAFNCSLACGDVENCDLYECNQDLIIQLVAGVPFYLRTGSIEGQRPGCAAACANEPDVAWETTVEIPADHCAVVSGPEGGRIAAFHVEEIAVPEACSAGAPVACLRVDDEPDTKTLVRLGIGTSLGTPGAGFVIETRPLGECGDVECYGGCSGGVAP